MSLKMISYRRPEFSYLMNKSEPLKRLVEQYGLDSGHWATNF